jgi:arsenate reductase-like glutaredoxin family protein
MNPLDNSVHALTNAGATSEIVVYTSSSCQKCSVLKEWLKSANQHFEERSLENVDVMTDLVMRNVVVLSAPVIEFENMIYTEDQFFEGNSLSVNRLKGILEGQ